MVIVSINKQTKNMITFEQTTIGHLFDHYWIEQYQKQYIDVETNNTYN